MATPSPLQMSFPDFRCFVILCKAFSAFLVEKIQLIFSFQKIPSGMKFLVFFPSFAGIIFVIWRHMTRSSESRYKTVENF